jgi:hypothetical protein
MIFTAFHEKLLFRRNKNEETQRSVERFENLSESLNLLCEISEVGGGVKIGANGEVDIFESFLTHPFTPSSHHQSKPAESVR